MQESASSFNVVQPGSSVATALSEGEAKPKHVLILEVLGEAWRAQKHPLRTVRPFLWRSVSPRTAALPSLDPGQQTCQRVGGQKSSGLRRAQKHPLRALRPFLVAQREPLGPLSARPLSVQLLMPELNPHGRGACCT